MENEKKLKTYSITTFGCQMNASDSERAAAVAESMGYIPNDDINSADLIIINSCSIRQKAEDRVVGMGKRIKSLKENREINDDIKVILTGCMAKREDRSKTDLENSVEKDSQEEYENKLKKLMPWLDFVVQIKDIHKLPIYMGKTQRIDVSEYLSVKPVTNKSFSQYIPISTGCNKFCTFCIVPFSRGREIYRPFNEILEEVKNSIASGAKEITLVGQNVNSWRGFIPASIPEESNKYIESKDPHRLLKQDMPENMMDFADLMEEIGKYCDELLAKDNKKIWIKFTSSHPYDIDEKLVSVIGKYNSLVNQFHFALQSGSNSVLRRMNRHYTIEEFIKKCEMIREKIPGVGISSDIIVGFCMENEKEFEETAEAMRLLKFDQVFISEYSNRKGTVASKVYKDNVPNEVKAERKVILNTILAEGIKTRNEVMLGNEYDVLIYKKNKNGFVGRTENGKDVIIKNSLEKDLKAGEFNKVKITNFTNWSLEGEIL